MKPSFSQELRNFEKIQGEIPQNDFSSLCDYITKFMMTKYDLPHPSSINQGYCFIWAYLVYFCWPNKTDLSFVTATNHICLGFQGKFYDSAHFSEEAAWVLDNPTFKSTILQNACGYWARADGARREFKKVIWGLDKALFRLIRGKDWYWKVDKSYNSFPGHCWDNPILEKLPVDSPMDWSKVEV